MATVTAEMFVCGDCCYALTYAEYGAPNAPIGMWCVDTDYMRESCEDGSLLCGECARGNPDDHEHFSESSPRWECEGCGETNVMFNTVYRMLQLED